METRANYATIGLFTLAVIAAAFAFVYWLARYDDVGSRRTMQVVVPGAVTGLSKGGLVLFNGIKIGEVATLTIKPDDPNQVIVEASVDSEAPIKADTKAALGVNPLTGVAYIQLAGGSAGSPDILDEPGTPTLTGDRESFADLLSGAQSVISKVDRAMDRVNTFVDKAEPSLDSSLASIQSFSDALAKNSSGMGDFLDNVSKLSNTLEGLSGKLEGLVEHTDAVVTAVDPEKVKATVTDIQQLAQRLNVASTRIESLLGKADDMMSTEGGKNFFQEAAAAATSLRRVSETFEEHAPRIAGGLDRFSNRGLDDLAALIGDARKTLARFDGIVSRFEQNPQQLIFGGNSGVREYNRK
jgi:phospholipid/cholesterol/gamma-HCH transport system substrate-binding protein